MSEICGYNRPLEEAPPEEAPLEEVPSEKPPLSYYNIFLRTAAGVVLGLSPPQRCGHPSIIISQTQASRIAADRTSRSQAFGFLSCSGDAAPLTPELVLPKPKCKEAE